MPNCPSVAATVECLSGESELRFVWFDLVPLGIY